MALPRLLAALLLAMASSIWLSEAASEVPLQTVDDLANQYNNIFKTGNRNAASHLWSSFVFNRSKGLEADTFQHLFVAFCPVSGSPLPDDPQTSYLVTLPKVGGGSQRGVVHHCCWPCACDLLDAVQVDAKVVSTADGEKTYDVLVIGNPCSNTQKLFEPFTDPFSGQKTSLAESAPEVKCDGGNLRGAETSSHGHPIIGMFFTEANAISAASNKASELADMCSQRQAQGYNSGMGLIFHKVASVTPLAGSAGVSLAAAGSSSGQHLRGRRRQEPLGARSLALLDQQTSAFAASNFSGHHDIHDCRMRSEQTLRCKMES